MDIHAHAVITTSQSCYVHQPRQLSKVQTLHSRFTTMQHQQQDSLFNPRPPISDDVRTHQKQCASFTADVARAVIVGGNEVDERTSRSKDTGKRTQRSHKAKIVHPKTDAQPKQIKRRKLDFVTTETARPIGFDIHYRYIPQRKNHTACLQEPTKMMSFMV